MPGACILIVASAYLLISAGIEDAIQRGGRVEAATSSPDPVGGGSLTTEAAT